MLTPRLRRIQRRRSMLRYLVEETVAGRGERLKGSNLAMVIFGRDQNFDPQSDPIVRIEAGRLRSALDGYYAGAGHNDDLRIVIPKGGYASRAYWQNDTPTPLSEFSDDIGRPAPPTPSPVAASALSTWPPFLFFGGGMILVASVVWISLTRPQPPPPTIPTEVNAVPLIVLPFAARETGSEEAFLAAGMTQQLIADLALFSGLKLYTASASFQQDPYADAAELGKDLDVSYIVRGSVAQEANRLHVLAQLEEADNGRVVWSKAYNFAVNPQEIIAAREDVSAEIASQLGQSNGAIKIDMLDNLAPAQAADMGSYLCVLQAQRYRVTFDEAAYGKVLDCLQLATQHDPGYADAWAMLGWLRLDAVRFDLVSSSAAADTMAAATAAATKAVELNPDGILGLQALAAIDYYSDRYEASERRMRHALELNPNDPETQVQLGWRLAARGNWAEGLPLVQSGIARTMGPPGWYFHAVAVRKYLDGDYTGAIKDAERSAMNGSSVGLVVIAAAEGQLGNPTQASQALATLGDVDPDMLKDPAQGFRAQKVIQPIIEPLLEGLKMAGWRAP